MTSKINIAGELHDSGSLQLPESGRLFRDHFIKDGDFIRLDIDNVRSDCHALRREWRAAKERQPFAYQGATFTKDKDSVDRIVGLMKMAEIVGKQGLTINAVLTNRGGATTFTPASGTPPEITEAFLDGLFMAMAMSSADTHDANIAKSEEIEAAPDEDALVSIYKVMQQEIESYQASA